MAKIKLMSFEIISLLGDSKKIVDYLQKTGAVQFEDATDEELIKYKTTAIVSQLENKLALAKNAYTILEENCKLKKSLIESFSDCKQIEYSDYKMLSDKSEELTGICREICLLKEKIDSQKAEIIKQQSLIDYYTPWQGLDIPMASKRTVQTAIFIGTFKNQYSAEEILAQIKERDEDLDDVAVEIVHSEKMLTCAVFMCHDSSKEKLEAILRDIGFVIPDKVAMKLPDKAQEDCRKEIEAITQDIDKLTAEIKEYESYYSDLRFLSDFFNSQIEKYKAVENAGSTEMAFYIKGYVPQRVAEDIKFEIERSYRAQMELYEPDYENEDVPVLIENKSFAAGVESITDMYSSPSNKDV
ncbi:MAG: hypothetical protein J6V06_09615, partial [Clostridia bacterium]|nr:hypothetical protein [Clostridia bacterium]